MLEQQLPDLESAAVARIHAAQSTQELEQVRVEVLGRKGSLAQVSKDMGKLAPEDRGRVGKLLNAAKQKIEAAFEARLRQFDAAALEARLECRVAGSHAARARPPPRPSASHHADSGGDRRPFRLAGLRRAGRSRSGRPNIYNFDALNIPGDHPARDMQDTFWLTDGNLLRTHTSPVQVRGMERLGPPLRMIAPGRVFRNENVDASHEHTFYQLEGMMIDRDVSVAHLIYFMKTLLSAIFHREVTVRLRPGYFPFVEPGFELDIQCLICGGPGCPVCKQSGWVELLPCGLVQSATCCA